MPIEFERKDDPIGAKSLSSILFEDSASKKSDMFYDERWAVQKQTNFFGVDDKNVIGTDAGIQ